MEEFQKELDALLMRYPSLPEFTMTVRPRITIDIKQKTPPYISPAFSNGFIPPPSIDNVALSVNEMNDKMIAALDASASNAFKKMSPIQRE